MQKILARAGFGSRRACEQLIAAGRVTLDGAVVQLGDRADPLHQRLALDGVPVVTRPDLVYYVLNKPRDVVTTARDPEGRPTVLELVPAQPRVFPVGRLDYETEGILILTNDGDLAQVLTHPSFGVDKTYLAEVDGLVADAALRTLRTGVELDDGPTQPARVRILSASESTVRGASGSGRTALELTIHEGRNRQIRRMCDAVGLTVRRLVRTRLGPLRDPGLSPGEWRPLDGSEVRALYESAHGSKQTSH